MLFSGLRKQSDTTYKLFFMLISSTDHITGLTGKSGSVVVSLSKNGAGGGAPAGAIGEVDATNLPGLYSIAGNATDSNTLGPLFLHAKDAASDPYDSKYDIVNYDPFTFLPDVNATQVNGTSQTAGDLATLLVDLRKRGFNKLSVTDATGGYTLFNDDSTTPLYTGTITDNSTTTTRTKMA